MPNKPTHLAPASSAGDINSDDFGVASTISEMERDATGKAARAFYEFWNTGDEALLKKALAENFADCAVRPPCAPATIGLRPNRRLGASEKEPR
jgi:hypothetical protein